MLFVPHNLQAEQVPCRFVQLTSEGSTVNSLYRYGTPTEAHEALRTWLTNRIHEIKEEMEISISSLPLAG